MEKLKSLFFTETLRQWHFEALVQESGMSRERVASALKMLLKEKYIRRVKPRGQMPYYLAQRDEPRFREEKRLYGLHVLTKSGLFSHLSTCPKIKTAILFGSFARGDWSKSSDVDLFLYGDAREFDKESFEKKLGRTIQLFSYNDARTVKKELDPVLLPNILKGFALTESLEPFTVSIHA
ncbi:MAG: nucleotidyltransferase domain-containing protein [Nanoarchaeota archaeon]|nr:nucleotidyltransferase domain-containing protein [Nanoarchaeota archaeon]